MTITIINDCKDGNVVGRQLSRASALLQGPASFIGVASDLEASGNLVDALDATDGGEAVVLVNVAPRHKKAKKWPNGSPFCYFFYKKTLVVATVDGATLSLVKKLGLIQAVHVFDIPKTLDAIIAKGRLPKEVKDRIVHSQFRSFDFVPRAAAFVVEEGKAPAQELSIQEIPDAEQAVWWVDNFGNCKTTLLPEDVDFTPGKKRTLTGTELTSYTGLKDVPDDELGCVIGSSGLEDKRFLEIVVQGGSAADRLELKTGDVIV